MIKVGDKIPEAHIKGVGERGIQDVHIPSTFNGKRVVIFGVPGAFTPLCSKAHVPSFMKHVRDFKHKGIDKVFCVSVNDPFVMEAWKKDLGADDDIFFLADGNGTWIKSLGLTLDASGFGLGERSQRFAMVVDDGILKLLELEKTAGACDATSGDSMLNQI